MNNIINFDNAATTFPKPPEVRAAMMHALNKCGGNAGRGGHKLSIMTSEAVFDSRQTAADFFGAQPENVIFTLNCTHALNLAIQGIIPKGGHVIISSMEHNSVARVVYALRKQGVSASIADVSPDDSVTISNFKRLIKRNTAAIVCTAASNVTGQILPFREIGRLCSKNGICFILDGAQGCGILDIDLERDNINILCTAGHKGLYGPPGTGMLISDGKFTLRPLIQGGTGSSSMDLEQPDFLPDSLESGTLNTCGIIALKKGIDFVKKKTCREIYRHEDELCRLFISQLNGCDKVKIYRVQGVKYAPIVSFTIDGETPEETAERLSKYGFCLRAGLHCAPLAHKTMGTEEGTVRFAPSVFNNRAQVIRLCNIVKSL